MTAKEHLQQVKRYYDLVRNTEDEIRMMQAQMDGMSGFAYDKERVQVSLTGSNIDDAIILIEERKKSLEKFKRKYVQIFGQVSENIQKMKNEREKTVLINRYLEFKEWGQVFSEMGETQDVVFSLHKRALTHYRY